MAKVTAAELDTIIVLIPRLNLRQLQRLDTIVNAELLRKMGTPEDQGTAEKGA